MISAHLTLDPHFTVGPINRRLFGGFVEHLGRCVYDGIYEPGHPKADADGFRTDVIDLVRELGVTTVRYPGGNFVSGFRWEDSVGPRETRPRRLDLAWHSVETNHVGLHEFSSWLDKVGCELMLAVNLGTRGPQEALDLLEYSNIRSGTSLSDERVSNGRREPLGVTMGCLGNEMDGPWQLGHRDAQDYGKLASRTAKAMRQLDERLELAVCGSSGSAMPTFGSWDRTVLEHTYEDVDFISCHAYYQEHHGHLDSFLASAVNMDHFIDSVVATADSVKAQLRSMKSISISFDEWNVWCLDRYETDEKVTDIEEWPYAPHLLEDVYSVADAVVLGSLFISLLRHADRVQSASLAQLVNVIAAIMTEHGGDAWRQTTFFPFALTSRLAQGDVIEVKLSCDTYETAEYGSVGVVDAVATHSPETGAVAVFLVNRSRAERATVSIDVHALGLLGVADCQTLTDDDTSAANTAENTDRVTLVDNLSASVSDGVVTISLPAVSWTALALRSRSS